LEAERAEWLEAGFSATVTDTALSAKRTSTRTVYDSCWSMFLTWCKEKELDPLLCSEPNVLDFLQFLVTNGRALNTVRGYVTALSSRLGLFRCAHGMVPLASPPAVRTWLRGVKRQRLSYVTRFLHGTLAWGWTRSPKLLTTLFICAI
jgi:hypothetical protein